MLKGFIIFSKNEIKRLILQKKIYVAFLHCKTDAACLDRELNKLTTYFCNAI